ncbi:ribosome silencing factor [Enterococcus camelliae]|uniref:Ribosomal silencing factor RsfS n=1 Tax=Enterococcus camelliae TaxID=453959 RepID=A0ABW5TIH7_9ENTE
MVELAVRAADSKRAEDILVLNVKEVSLLADYFMICSGNNERQIQAIADTIIDKESEANVQIKQIEGKDSAKWILIDLGDVIVHVFSHSERSFYNLEKLWSNAPLLNITEWIDD